MENKYLHTEFAGYSGINEQYEISADIEALPVNNAKGQELFRVKLKPGRSFLRADIRQPWHPHSADSNPSIIKEIYRPPPL